MATQEFVLKLVEEANKEREQLLKSRKEAPADMLKAHLDLDGIWFYVDALSEFAKYTEAGKRLMGMAKLETDPKGSHYKIFFEPFS